MLCLLFLLCLVASGGFPPVFVVVWLFSGVTLPWPKEGCLERNGNPETTWIECLRFGLDCKRRNLCDGVTSVGSSEYFAELGDIPDAAILSCLLFISTFYGKVYIWIVIEHSVRRFSQFFVTGSVRVDISCTNLMFPLISYYITWHKHIRKEREFDKSSKSHSIGTKGTWMWHPI